MFEINSIVFLGFAAFVWGLFFFAVVRFIQVATQHDEDDEQ